MKRGSHRHGGERLGKVGGFVSSLRAERGLGGAHSRRPKHRRTEAGRIRRARNPIILFVCAFVVASGSAAFAYNTTPGSGKGQAQAIALGTPGKGSASSPTTTSLSLSWVAATTLPADGGYLVLRSAAPGGPYAKVSSGSCQQSITLVSRATSCTDTGLTTGTTYYYQVEAAYYDISTLWVSTPDAEFSGTTSSAGQSGQSLSITSADSTTFAAGGAGRFTVTTVGSPVPALTDKAFPGCTPSILPGTVTLVDDHNGTATLAGTPPAAGSGTSILCLTASNGTSTATQSFSLRVVSGAEKSAPAITSPSSANFLAGSAGTFQAAASGSPAPTFSNAAFQGCSPSLLPSGITFSSNGSLSGTPGVEAVGIYTVCINAVNGVGPGATQRFTLTIGSGALVFSSPPVSGATSSTPNLGPITVRRQSSSGAPITSGGALTVNLTGSPGATFGAAQFASTPMTSVTIPSGQAAATFWYGSTATGISTIGATAQGYSSGSQQETITTAPAGLGIAPATGSTGSPVMSCGPPSAASTCNVTGVGPAGRFAFSVMFLNAGQGPAEYSASQPSTIHEAGQATGSVTIGAGASGSGPNALSATLGPSTLTFGPYTLTVTVGA